MWTKIVPPFLKDHFFKSLFLTCAMIITYFKVTYPEMLEVIGGMRFLTKSTEGAIGQATFFELEINSRVRAFYGCLVLLPFGILAFNWVFGRISRLKRITTITSFKILETVAMVGCLMVLFYALRNPVTQSFNLVLVVFATFSIITIAQYILKSSNEPGSKQYLWMGLIAFSVSYFFMEITKNSLIWYPAFVLVFVGLFLVRNFWKPNFRNVVKITTPIAAIPLLSFVSDELYLTFKSHGKTPLSDFQWYSLLTGLLIAVLLTLSLMYRKKTSGLQETVSLNAYYLLILVGISCLSSLSWQYGANEWTAEKFEMANPQLAIFKFYEFDKIPLLESFNSHALSELVNIFSYTFLNGYEGDFSMYNYSFVSTILAVLAAFYLLKKFFNSSHVAFFIVLIIPVTLSVIDLYYPFLWFGAIALYNAVQQKTIRNYFLFWLCFALNILWAIDQGVLFVVATFVSLIGLLVLRKIGTNDIKPGLAGLFLLLCLLGIPTLILVIARDIPIFENLGKVWNYISSHQTWGYRGLGLLDERFMLHYLLFPIAGILGLGYIFYQRNQLRVWLGNRENGFKIFLFAFLIIATFANAHRGLDRHSFVEFSDYISGFMYGAFAIAIWYGIRTLKFQNAFFLTTLSVTLLLLGFKYPQYPTSPSTYEIGERLVRTKLQKNIAAVQDRGHGVFDRLVTTKYSHIKAFDQSVCNEGSNQSFIDFANIPMMYYYLKRPVPSYFCQTLASAHNFELQHQFVEDCKNADLPYAIVSTDYFGFDIDFPNEIRHPIIADYLFSNYRPAGILDSVTVWVRKDDQYKKWLPKQYLEFAPFDSVSFSYQRKDTSNLVTIRLSGNLKNGAENSLIVNDTLLVQPAYVNPKFKEAFFNLNIDSIHSLAFYSNGTLVKPKQISVYESVFPMDYYHESPEDYFLGMVPHFFANYEYNASDFDEITPLQHPGEINLAQSRTFMIPESFRQSKQNTLLSFKATTHKTQSIRRPSTIKIEFGSGNQTFGRMAVFLSPRDQPNYLVHLSSQYNWHLKNSEWIRFNKAAFPCSVSDVALKRVKQTVRK